MAGEVVGRDGAGNRGKKTGWGRHKPAPHWAVDESLG